ncbi:Conserved hypothetical protein [Micromonospora lupini str. Lupac 08]|uniref:Uncharacterized protein n=1 Tax=Micromonospora lupini str. Lupac 08 TaxID=1150864 RepID=I0KZY6_9ACTN|nr:Conserved hypothetical protein [Micromonospora lupini str. Lupac 08]
MAAEQLDTPRTALLSCHRSPRRLPSDESAPSVNEGSADPVADATQLAAYAWATARKPMSIGARPAGHTGRARRSGGLRPSTTREEEREPAQGDKHTSHARHGRYHAAAGDRQDVLARPVACVRCA